LNKPSFDHYYLYEESARTFFIVSAVLGGYEWVEFAYFIKRGCFRGFFGFYRHKTGLKQMGLMRSDNKTRLKYTQEKKVSV
jgi:hypothetical protein